MVENKEIYFINIYCTLHNTFFNFIDMEGRTIISKSLGQNYKRKTKSLYSSVLAEAKVLGKDIRKLKVRKSIVILKGKGKNKLAGLKGLTKFINPTCILDKSTLSYNGCKLRTKKRK